MKEVVFNYDYLRACMPYAAKNEVRFYLCGIYLGDGFMAATDGHKMILIEDECFDGCDYILPRESVDFFIKKLKTNPMNKNATLKVMDDGFNLMECMGHYEYFKSIDGKFPDVKKVDIPKPEKSEGRPIFNIKYLSDILKSYRILNGSNHQDGLDILCNGDKNSAYIELTGNAHAVLMPMRI